MGKINDLYLMIEWLLIWDDYDEAHWIKQSYEYVEFNFRGQCHDNAQ